MAELILNAGSSTLKAALFDKDRDEPLFTVLFESPTGGTSAAGKITWRDGRSEIREGLCATAASRLDFLIQLSNEAGLSPAPQIDAVAHRVVHGGESFSEPVMIDSQVIEALEKLIPLAPLHQPQTLHLIEAAQKVLPSAQQVAVFDTAYFANLPPQHRLYPVPYEWAATLGIRRFGFHGISHQWCAEQAARMLGSELDRLNLISCHLGSGCSLTAIRAGKPIATSMGFTPLDGVMMGTRPGSLDPGILLYLLQSQKMKLSELNHEIEQNSGLKGISGVSPHLFDLEPLAQSGHVRAKLAIEMFADSVRKEIGGMAVTLGRVDALIFTGGAGEKSPQIRKMVCQGLDLIGFQLDLEKNRTPQLDVDISRNGESHPILVIANQEELAMRNAVCRLMKGSRL